MPTNRKSMLILILLLLFMSACSLLPSTEGSSSISTDIPKSTAPTDLPATTTSLQEPTPTASILPPNTFGVVDNSTLYGKAVIGYQGWFGCPDDGSQYDDWIHWFEYDGIPTINKLTVDYWPDVSELTEAELCETKLKDAQGNMMYAFSSYNSLTVRRHFYWMAQNGIDGVELQRFATVFLHNERRLHQDQVLKNVKEGAEAYGRVFFIQYDGIEKQTLEKIKQDWIYLMDTLQVQSSPAYLHHNGLPVVGLWGMGFKGRDITPEEASDLIDFFQNHPDPKYRATVLGGVPSYWRTLTADSAEDPAWAAVFRSYDIINPWHVNSIYDKGGADIFLRNVILPDLEETRTLGIDYMPVIFPGFSWNNMMHDGYNKTPRDGGNFLWKLAYNVISQNVDMIEVAMFDEVDEGTAIFKLVPHPDQLPSGKVLIPLDVDGYNLPSDWYLVLAGRLTQMLRGEIPLTANIEDLPSRVLGDLLMLQLDFTTSANWNTLEILNPGVIHSLDVVSMEGDQTRFSATPAAIVINQSLGDAQAGKTITLHVTILLEPAVGSDSLEMILTKGSIGTANLRFFTLSDGVETTLKEISHSLTNDSSGTNPLDIILPLDLIE
jgi:hypothetical protein